MSSVGRYVEISKNGTLKKKIETAKQCFFFRNEVKNIEMIFKIIYIY